MRLRAVIWTLWAAVAFGGCGARSALTPDDPGSADGWVPADAGVDRDPGSDLRPVCAPLVDRRGSYRGSWQGIVNCLVEKHPTQGTLSLDLESGATQAEGLRISGQFSGTFSNGLSLKSRILGRLSCNGQARVDLLDITVGKAQVAQLTGWLRNWVFSDQGGTHQGGLARRISGAWRIDQWEPLCIGAGSWEVTRELTQ